MENVLRKAPPYPLLHAGEIMDGTSFVRKELPFNPDTLKDLRSFIVTHPCGIFELCNGNGESLATACWRDAVSARADSHHRHLNLKDIQFVEDLLIFCDSMNVPYQQDIHNSDLFPHEIAQIRLEYLQVHEQQGG